MHQVLGVKTIRINTRLARCHTSTQGSKGDYNKQHCLLYRAYMESPHAGVTCVAAIPMILSGCCLYTPESAHKSEFTWAWLSAPGRRSTVFFVWQIPVTLSTPWLLVGKYIAGSSDLYMSWTSGGQAQSGDRVICMVFWEGELHWNAWMIFFAYNCGFVQHHFCGLWEVGLVHYSYCFPFIRNKSR